jgi:hypothetical protein
MQPDSQKHANGHAVAPMQANGQERTRQPSLLSYEVARPRERLSVSIVIPTLNEAGNIGTVLRQLRSFEDIVLVDGFSEADTVEIDIESQILGHAALAGLRIAEVPNIELPRLAGDSHLNARKAGTRILRAMLTARFATRASRCAVALRPLVPSD